MQESVRNTVRRASIRNDLRDDSGYALASVLFLVTILAVLSVIVLRADLARRQMVVSEIDKFKSLSASQNGTLLAMNPQVVRFEDTTFSVVFDDSSRVEVDAFRWGLFYGVTSRGMSHRCETTNSILVASALPHGDSVALAISNLQHGLVFAGSAKIVGNVVTGPMGVSTGSLRNFLSPKSLPLAGRKITVKTSFSTLDTSWLSGHVAFTKTLISRVRRSRANPDDSASGVMKCVGVLDLKDIGDSIREVYCYGSILILDSIMRRGPPLFIVALGAVSFAKNVYVSGPVSICSSDSICLSPGVACINCILTSEKSITLLPGCKVISQLFAPRLKLSGNTLAAYPSAAVSVSFVDTSGAGQSVEMQDGASVEGFVMMHRGSSTAMNDAVISLSPGATVVGGVYSDAYLTMDGVVDGYVRTFDLYFYDSPTTYVGWLRQGSINRNNLPNGFLGPIGEQGLDPFEMLCEL